MANHVMIDLETLHTDPDCVVLTIGAVRFDPRGDGIAESLELKPTVEDQIEQYNRSISEDTLRWWSEQSPEALDEAFSDSGRIPFAECMEILYKFCWNRQAIWSNGALFDLGVIENAWRQTSDKSNPIPWKYWSIRDARTLYDISGINLQNSGFVTSHRAINDATQQAIVVQHAYKKIKSVGLINL